MFESCRPVPLVFLLTLTACVSAQKQANANQALEEHFNSQITPPTYVDPTPIPLDASQQETVRQVILRRLKDPGSAMFGGYLARRDASNPAIIHVCGDVNSRNSYGGYSGAYPYYGRLIGLSFELESIDGPGWGRAWGFCDPTYGVLKATGS